MIILNEQKKNSSPTPHSLPPLPHPLPPVVVLSYHDALHPSPHRVHEVPVKSFQFVSGYVIGGTIFVSVRLFDVLMYNIILYKIHVTLGVTQAKKQLLLMEIALKLTRLMKSALKMKIFTENVPLEKLIN